MALKIFTGAKPFLKAYMKPFDITEIRMLTPSQEDWLACMVKTYNYVFE
jgi:hypothetical protein